MESLRVSGDAIVCVTSKSVESGSNPSISAVV